jgi:CBS domain-containing protein
MAIPIRDIMTSRVVTVRSGEPVSAAVERMTQFGFSALPVVTASSRLVGIVSLLDVLRHRQESGDGDRGVTVDEIMTTDVFTMAPTANAATVADRLYRNGELRVLPICEGRRLVGVITRGDLLRGLLPGSRAHRRGGGLLSRLLGGRDDGAGDALALLAAARRPRPPAVPQAPVRDVMTTEVVTAQETELVEDAAVGMLRGRHSSLPVVDAAGRVLGVVSEADLLGAAAGRRPGPLTVGRVMTAPAVTVPADATVATARALVLERGLRTLPVVDGDGRLVGVLGRSDLV